MSIVFRRRAALPLCLLAFSIGTFSGAGCSRKADAATVQAIQAAYDKQSAAYSMRNAAGVLSVCHPNYEDMTGDGVMRRPEYDQMIQSLLTNVQSCSIRAEVIEARLDGERCRVTVNRQIQASVFNAEDQQIHQVALEEMNSDTWERDPAKGWLKRRSSVINQKNASGVGIGVGVGIHGTVRTRSGPSRMPRVRIRRR
jgi:hypothetical protein